MKILLLSKILLLALFFALLPIGSAWAAVQHALAMVGEPTEQDGFLHLSFTNPDAPKGGILRLAAVGSFDSLNPFIVRGQPPFGLETGRVFSLVYESLMARSWGEPFTLYPLIAESVDLPDDRSSVTFTLNPRAHFSDGVPITADDVLFSLETLRAKGRPNHRSYYKKVLKTQKLSPTCVRFDFKKDETGRFDREMPLIIGLMPILPQHAWQGRDFAETSLRLPVGSGPYKITKVDAGRSLTYTRDPAYWGRDLPVQRGLYNFDTIRVDYYRDEGVALQAFKSGQYDLRRESDATKWATAYDFPAAQDGRVRLENMPHHRTEPAYGFILNTRRPLFTDPVFRAALEESFDAAWVDRTLFHSQYKRVNSFFPNSELAAPLLPEGRELEILNAFRDRLPPEIFTTPVAPPEAADEDSFRAQLLKAETMLHAAGYRVKADQLFTKDGQPVRFEIMLSNPAEEKIALTWARALKRLGIETSVRTLDSAQYQARLSNFDYDVTAARWFNSLSPGNEQIYFWGSAAADQKGSRNYAGVKDPVVDALAAAVSKPATREELIATAHALDRVLMQGHYFVPLFYTGSDLLASWTPLQHPPTPPLYGTLIESWWRP